MPTLDEIDDAVRVFIQRSLDALVQVDWNNPEERHQVFDATSEAHAAMSVLIEATVLAARGKSPFPLASMP
jgi:hypothetical protein